MSISVWRLEFLLLVLFIIFSLSHCIYEPTTIPASEYYALQDLYNSTGGDDWLWGDIALQGAHWFDDAPDPCSTPVWQGLNCTCATEKRSLTKSCYINSIKLDNYRIRGRLPESLTYLAHITMLSFGVNELNGTIPSFIANFSKLVEINLNANSFTGTFPEFLNSMTKLETLILSANDLTGPIPPSIRNLTSLQQLDLSVTKINGTIPEELYSLSALEVLVLGSTLLSGTLSESLGNLTNLIELSLYSTNINGTIPEAIGQLQELQVLYLYDMLINGTLPSSFYWLQNLQLAYLYENKLYGYLSDNIGNMTSLADFCINNNNFYGSIPRGIGQMPSLRVFQAFHNYFEGSLPEELYNVSTLNNLYLYNNILTGKLSNNISRLKDLTEATIYDNYFTGPFPVEICQCKKLYNFDLYINYLSGPLPACIFDMKALTGFRIYDNLLTGSLPRNFSSNAMLYLSLYGNSLTGRLPDRVDPFLISVEIFSNQLTGPIPDAWFRNKSAYQTMYMDQNFFSSSLPKTIGDLHLLKYLYLYNNLLSGSLPQELSKISYLIIGFFNNNIFSGRIACFNATTQPFLTSIELSGNQLTGPLPEEPFLSVDLQTFAVVSNCLTGTIPEAVCKAKYLSALAIDGMHTASSCQQKILPFFNSYTVKYTTPGSIPSCLFSLSSMQTLHASGNGLSGSLPSDLQLSSGLSDLVLSHNAYDGQIPTTISKQNFTNLDMSYNKLSGILDDTNVSVPNNGYLYMQVNRLSGQIPQNLKPVKTISILDGNLFECSYTRESLPEHDSQYQFYQCGTSSLQHALYVWIILGSCFVVLLILMFLRRNSDSRSALVSWFRSLYKTARDALDMFTEDAKTGFMLPNIVLLGKFLRSLRYSVLVITVYVVVVLLTINVILSKYYGTYQYKYAWNVSSVYVSGYTPAVVLLVFLLLWLCWMFGTFHYFLIPFSTVDEKKMLVRGSNGRDSDGSDNTRASDADSKHSNYKHYLWLTAIAVFNCSIVLAVNIGYVYATTKYRPTVVAIVQLIIALFKLGWNDVAVQTMTNIAHYYSTRRSSGESVQLTASQQRKIEGKYMTFHTYTMLFNIIVTPCLATAFVSADCFYNVIFPADKIELSYNYLTCGTLLTLQNASCPLDVLVTTQTSYSPPYLYRYQCSSTLVTTYAVLYVYMFVLTGFLLPLIILLQTWYNDKYKKQNLRETLVSTRGDRLFFKDRFILRMITFLSVYVTFGVIFPPLAVIICCAIWVHSYLNQLVVGYRINAEGTSDQTQRLALLEVLERDCVNTADLFKHSLYDVGPMAALFYSFIIFDTYGDAAGGSAAVGVTVTMIVVGTVLSCAAYIALNVDTAKWWSQRQAAFRRATSSAASPMAGTEVSECEMQRTTSVLAAVRMVEENSILSEKDSSVGSTQ